ncbi:hypothetical protein [Streptomyces sp. NPDC017949]|uniref:hypothetical protein n=1 Tax=Streptomyces sp. NPDC017949 TaxID=3365020 RepID=UPI0037A01C4D
MLVEEVTEMRRRKVTTCVLATVPVHRDRVPSMTYRDSRAVLRVLPAAQVIERIPWLAQRRLALALHALATGNPTYVLNGSPARPLRTVLSSH